MVDNRETCKIADFGLYWIPKDDIIYQATTEVLRPIQWMAPESLVNREFSPATDVWNFGVLLWEMYYPKQLPYAELSNSFQVISKILSGYRLSIPPNYPSTVARIMKACWQREPEKRPSFLLISQIIELHFMPWLQPFEGGCNPLTPGLTNIVSAVTDEDDEIPPDERSEGAKANKYYTM